MKKLNNKTVIITGASAGMGKAIALLFADQGANVVLADLHQKEINEVVEMIRDAGGVAIGAECNVSVEADLKKLFDMALKEFNSLDVLVNNAGVMDDFLPVDLVSDDHWNKVMGVNVNSVFYTCRLALPIMLKQGKGVIVNIASVGGLYGARAGFAYTASKHAVSGMTKNIGFMYAKQGIRCNAIAPGGVNTNIGKNMKPNPFGYERCVSGAGSMPRMGEAGEIASAALFLASDDSSFVNGTILTVDGGWSAY